LSSDKPSTGKQLRAELDELWESIFPGQHVSEAERPLSKTHASGSGELDALAVLSVLRLATEIQRKMESFVRPLGLTTSRMGVLLNLYFAERRLTPSQLGERLFVTRGNMTGLIDGLAADGLVQRVTRAEDRRAQELELTEAGYALLRDYLPRHQRALAALTAGLNEDERLQLALLVKRLRAGMQPLERAEG
jgi:DNA-binding MarR family transcriptional regulator